MTEQLKPCPFCGNGRNIGMRNEKHNHSGGYFISCPECDASTGLRYAMGDDPRPLLIEAWNRRAQPAQAVPVLSDEEIVAVMCDGYNCRYNDEADHIDFARQIEQAVRAKMGVAVPMTDPQLQTSEERRATGERIASMLRVEEVGADLIRRARTIVVGHQRGSISLVQRHLQISYNTAAKLLEALEQEGVVSPQRQNGQREVLVLPDISGIVGKEGGNV